MYTKKYKAKLIVAHIIMLPVDLFLVLSFPLWGLIWAGEFLDQHRIRKSYKYYK